MTSVVACGYRHQDAPEWDAFVAASFNGTFLHTRRYMSHHRDRFVDRSLLFRDSDGKLLGLLPAALDPSDHEHVLSHPGLTYGGLIRGQRLAGTAVIDALRVALAYFADIGLQRFTYKAVPHIYHRVLAGDDLFALSELGALRTACELSTAIPLADRPKPSANRRRNVKRANAAGIEVVGGSAALGDYWQLLAAHLRERYGAKPVHSATELQELMDILPDQIRCVAALLEGDVVAGTVFYETDTVSHAQYIASNQRGRETCALDLVFARCIEDATDRGASWLDLGTSTARPASHLNESLHRWKVSFGGGGVVYETYRLDLGG
jgi:Acetyltransferase (GNAT) domain